MELARKHPWVEQLAAMVNAKSLMDERQRLRACYSPQLAYGRHFSPPSPLAKPAAAMVLLHQADPNSDWRESTIPLTVRPDHLPDHPGQISLPGGRVELGESNLQAAKRELEEELGLAGFAGEVVGGLEPVWVFNSNYSLQPFVAAHVGPLNYQPCLHEVARLILLPVRQLIDQVDTNAKPFSRGNVHWMANVFQHEDDLIWGATAIVLAELAAVLRILDRDS